MSCPNCACESCQRTRSLAAERENVVDDRARAILLRLIGLSADDVTRIMGRPSRAYIRSAERRFAQSCGADWNTVRRAMDPGLQWVHFKTIPSWERRLIRAGAMPVRRWKKNDTGQAYDLLDAELPPDNWPIGTTKRKP